ncbi:MAG: hypothetical protein L0I76_15435 [Pseudonocardia sp.]|nr:hypothetical protein [Pseudonocardia sp.]
MPQRQSGAKLLDFTSVPTAHRSVIKEFSYAMLSGELPPGERRKTVGTIKQIFGCLARFTRWLDRQPPPPGHAARHLADLTGSDLLEFQRVLISAKPNLIGRNNERSAIRMLWHYRDSLTSDRLPFDPQHLQGWSEPYHRPPENRTARIPEPVLGPVLAWSLRFVDDFAADILAADEFWRTHRQRRASPPRRSAGELDLALRTLLDVHIAERRPLPGHQGDINITFLAGRLGCTRTALDRRRSQLDRAAAIAGIAAESVLPTPITAHLDGQPWIEGVNTNQASPTGLSSLARSLQAACYVVIAFLSGMRDCEVKHLRRGCLRTLRDLDGNAYRHVVTSMAFKGERDPGGVEATWVVGAPAARAIEVLHRLQPPDTSLLFAVLPTSQGNKPHTRTSDTAISSATTNDQLAGFLTWINTYCAATGRADTVPDIDGRPVRLTTRQFRRTLAWFIARRPGGAIAGAIAYRHQAIGMFEGYAGTSESGFRAEVESEQALARGEHLLAMIDAHQHDQLAGPAAADAAQRLDGFGDLARFQGVVITDERRLQRLMRREDPAVYPDRYVTCVHKHATALCQQHRDTDGQLRPQLSACKPLSCRNVALTGDNVTAWRDEIDHIDHELDARPTLAPLLAHQLRARRTEITGFLDRHTGHQS